ncbi:hypothetical protein EGN72_11710 [Pseudorhodobacter sp. E13]|nr:hypothetical protein EGN72_11710 [Pseudorhodobacter sp. E13]
MLGTPKAFRAAPDPPQGGRDGAHTGSGASLCWVKLSLANVPVSANHAGMKASDIKDEDSLRLWLDARPLAETITISQRVALRVAPVWFAAMETAWDNEGKFSNLAHLRLLITAVATGANQTQTMIRVGQVVFNTAISRLAFSSRIANPVKVPISGPDQSDLEPAWAARAAAGYALKLAFDPTSAILRSSDLVFAARAASRLNFKGVWERIKLDCAKMEEGQALDGVPLWGSISNPFQVEMKRTRTRWAQPNSPYTFWLRWYEAALEGRSLNPELERDIALIPNAEWEKGAAHIAGLIALIEERFDLKAQVQALRQQLTFAQTAPADAAHRGHNQPPELIDSAPEVQRQITIIFDTLDDAEKELSKFAPSPSRLKVIGEALLNSAAIIARYCGGIANKAVGAAAVAFGTAGGALAAAKLIQFVTPVKTLGQSITDFALKWLGG